VVVFPGAQNIDGQDLPVSSDGGIEGRVVRETQVAPEPMDGKSHGRSKGLAKGKMKENSMGS